MTIIEVHSRLAITAILYAVIMMVWGLLRYFRNRDMDSNYWGAIVISEVLLLLQAGIGVYLFISGIGHLDRGYMHILYGIVAVLAVPAVFLFSKGDNTRRMNLIYGLIYIFQAGILVRSMVTG
jgi:heme A synthase